MVTLDCVKLTEPPHQVILVFITYQVGSKETAQSEPELAREQIWVLMEKAFVAGVKVVLSKLLKDAAPDFGYSPHAAYDSCQP